MPTLPSDSTEALLRPLSDAIAADREFPPLEGSEYMRSHVAFEAASDQQERIRAWLRGRLLEHPGPRVDVASVGAGSGILDVPLIEAVSAHRELRYHVVEPVEAQCEALKRRAEAQLGDDRAVDLSVECAPVEELIPSRTFDFVLAIHSTYYFADLPAALDTLLAMVRPGGRLLLGIAPREEMNRLAELFWSSQVDEPLQFEPELRALLSERVRALSVERIDARLTIAQHDHALEDVASFLIQTPLDALEPSLRAGVLDYLHAVGETRASGELEIPHPVSMIEARR